VHPVLFHIGSIVIPSYGAVAALGVLLALFLATRLARVAAIDPNHIWNLSVIAMFSALLGTRLLLVVVNWSVVRLHPRWLLGLAMIHHPVLAAFGVLAGGAAAMLYARWQHLPAWSTADVLAAPLALGLAFEQWGALLAGSGYGTETRVPWAVIYTHPLAARWSGTPLGIPLQPVQAYAAVAFLTLSLFLCFWLTHRHRAGDVAGLALLGLGTVVYITEFWRDPEGRGRLLGGALDGPQVAAIGLVLAGAILLIERKRHEQDSGKTQQAAAPGDEDPHA